MSTLSFASNELSFCYELQTSPPYIYINKSNPDTVTGIIIDLVKATGVEAGIDLKLYSQPWNRCIFDVRNGNADGVLAVVWQEKREKWGLFPKTLTGAINKEFRLWTANYLIFTNKKSPLKWDGQTISGVTTGIAAPLGYVVYEKLKQEKLLTPYVYEPNKGFKLVAKNRLNGYVINDLTGINIIKKLQLSQLVIPLKTPYMVEDLHLVFSKKITSDISQLIWQALAKVRKRDEAMLRKKYTPHL